jgi:hypothetical protein
MFENQSKEIRDIASVSEVAASIASRLARNRANSAIIDDPQQGEPSVPDETDRAYSSRQLDEGPAPKQVASQMSHDQLPGTKPTSDEYRVRADICLSWAREASTDEVRLACLTLANAWLKAAVCEESCVSDHLPLAPTL